MQDRHGNDLTTFSRAAADCYIAGIDHLLAATYGAVEAFEAAIGADPGFALAHAGLARAAMYGGDMARAKLAIAGASARAGAVTEREADHIGIYEALLSGRVAETRSRVMAHMEAWPRDVAIAQICTNIFGLIGLSGEPGRESLQLAYTTSLTRQLRDDWFVLSIHAQALCEVGRLDEAWTTMDRALDLNNANANASHFKAHTLYEQGQGAVGRAYLEDWIPTYDRRSLLFGHLNWHRALWALEQGDAATMWAVMDDALAPEVSTSLPVNVLTDVAALLHRADLAGVPVDPARWATLSAYATQHFPAPGHSFADIHAALCHAMAGEGARLAVFAEAQTGFAADLVRPVARAWAAMARSDWVAALDLLTPVMADHARVGGSRAQRDLLELTYLALLLRLGRAEEARRSMATRRPLFAAAAPVSGYA